MNQRQKAEPNRTRTPPSPSRNFPVGAAILVTFAVIVALGVWLSRSKPEPTANAPAATIAPKAQPGFDKLVGRWIRPDGGYVIELTRAEENGRLEAAYFNPDPIQVAQAEASRQGTTIRVFIELRGANYSGSTYTLTYEPESDQLAGEYFQALLQQKFEVAFRRLE